MRLIFTLFNLIGPNNKYEITLFEDNLIGKLIKV